MLTLLQDAEVYDPQPRGRLDLLLGGGRILCMSPRLRRTRGLGPLEVVALHGRIVTPGLIDQHCHVAGGGGEGGFQNRTPPVPFSALSSNGITTVVGLLGTDGVTRSVQEVLATARGLGAIGLNAYIYTGAYQYPTRTITQSVRSDLILIQEVIGTGEIAISDDRSTHPREAALAEIGAEARVGGMLSGKKGVVHLHVGNGPRGLKTLFALVRDVDLPVTQFVPTHLNRRAQLLDDAERWLALGGFIDLTSGIAPGPGDHQPVDPAAAMAALLKLKGGPQRLTMSSDSGGSSPVFDQHGNLQSIGVGSPATLWHELRKAVLHEKVPLERALPTVTLNVAKALGLEHLHGQLAEGASADLLVLDEQLAIQQVYARGRLLVRDGQPIVHGPFERSPETHERTRANRSMPAK